MSILKNGYMTEVLAELKRDAGKLWVEPLCSSSRIEFRFPNFKVCVGAYGAVIVHDDGPDVYTPIRFCAALKRLKTKGRK